jgi:hypothetical protein
MAPRRREPLLGALGAVGGLVGVAAARCGGGCASCLACALPALGLVAAALATGRRSGARRLMAPEEEEAPCSSP